MLRVTVDLIPFGKEDNKSKIGEIKIWNDGTGNGIVGNYGYETSTGKIGEIKDHPRQQHVFKLVQKVLDSLE